MTTNPSFQPTEPTRVVEKFRYPSSGADSPTAFNAWQNELAADPEVASPSHQYHPDSLSVDRDADQISRTQEAAVEFERGRSLGFIEGGVAERALFSAELERASAEKIEHALRLNEQFTSERERYVTSFEPEVVKLAIAIASLILRRELEIDPLMLARSVRIALREVAAKTIVKIYVPPATSDLWLETIEHLPDLKLTAKPTIVADDLLKNGDCRIETDMGSVDLGMHSQLWEVTRILLHRRVAAEGDASTLQVDGLYP